MITKDEYYRNSQYALCNGGQYTTCDNPDCNNAYHYMKDVSYSILNQDREDGLIIDLSFCSLSCLLKIDPIKEQFGVKEVSNE